MAGALGRGEMGTDRANFFGRLRRRFKSSAIPLETDRANFFGRLRRRFKFTAIPHLLPYLFILM
jgi:hypothetical protein